MGLLISKGELVGEWFFVDSSFGGLDSVAEETGARTRIVFFSHRNFF